MELPFKMERKSTSNGIHETFTNNSWRKNFQNKKILEKWRIALEDEIYTDILFHIGPDREEIKCHRLVLQLQSERLAELLSNAATEYDLENFNPAVFRKFLKYLYTDQLQMNGDEAILMLHIAKEFEILELSKKCIELVQRDISKDNAAFILEQAKILADKDLGRRTQEFILQNAEEVFKTEGFVKLSIECIRGLLLSNEKNITEVNAFEAVRKWAIAESERECEDNIYSVAEKVFNLIDFSKFSAMEFTQHVVLTKSLPDAMLLEKLTELSLKSDGENESKKPLKNQNPEDSTSDIMLPEDSAGNKSDQKLVLERYDNIVTEVWPDTTNGKYKVSFKTSKPVSIKGVELYGWKNEEEKTQKITFQLTDYEEGKTFAKIEKTCHLPPSQEYVEVDLSDGFKTDGDTWYTIIVIVKGTLNSYGSGGKKKYVMGSGDEQIIFELKNSKQVSGPSHLRGQIPRILFSLC